MSYTVQTRRSSAPSPGDHGLSEGLAPAITDGSAGDNWCRRGEGLLGRANFGPAVVELVRRAVSRRFENQ